MSKRHAAAGTDGFDSQTWFERAKRVIPGGVNSPVRAFGAVGGAPVFMTRGKGAVLTTCEGRRLVDFCGSWGPLLLGHAPGALVHAVRSAAADGTSFGACTPREVAFAETLVRMVPSLEKVRLVSSGTEAVMTAIRLARGFTGRRRIIKFEGCYHGHTDALLVAAGSGLLTGGISSSAGVTEAVAAETLVLPYNDSRAVAEAIRQVGADLAAIIVEPVAGNMGLVPPEAGFLEELRRLADQSGAVLIFDEVITGFRLGPTTYGHLAGIRPDLTCLGKIIGGGLPIGAVGGRADIMDKLAPLGPVYQAGTLSGNPVAVAAGQAMLDRLTPDRPYARLAELGARIAEGLNQAAARRGLAFRCAQLGGMFTPFFAAGPLRNLAEIKTCNTAHYAAFFQGMLRRGFYLPPSQFELAFVSAAHTDRQVSAFLKAATAALGDLA
jgi:glutamate-1-semialdehyde 2,1-aminomutase